jgi:hypothetical protein
MASTHQQPPIGNENDSRGTVWTNKVTFVCSRIVMAILMITPMLWLDSQTYLRNYLEAWDTTAATTFSFESNDTISSPPAPAMSSPRISFSIHPGERTTVTHPKYQCRSPAGNKRNRTYSPNLLDHVTVATTISTNLKIAMVGDSLGYQFFHALEDAMTASSVTEHLPLYYTYRQIHEGLTLVSPVSGSGTLAFWRMTGMWIGDAMNKPLPYRGKGWLPDHATLLLNTTIHNQTTDGMDAMVFRIPHGWIRGGDVTVQSLNETVEHARKYLHVECIVLVAMFFNNNIRSHVGWQDLQEANARVRQFAADSDFPILILDMDTMMHGIMEANFAELGMTNSYYTSWINASVQERLPGKNPPSVVHVCANRPSSVGTECDYNFVSQDGMHVCMETLGGRINAGIACLLGCFFNEGVVDMLACERECNARYMNPNVTFE